jgi:parallel beta-helix repeat protein
VAEPGETVILEGTSSASIGVRIVSFSGVYPSFNEVSGFQIRKYSKDCVSYDSVPDIRLVGLDITQCGRQSAVLHRAQRVTLEQSRIHDSNTDGWTSAIDLYLCKDGNIIRGNTVWNNSDQPAGQPDSEGHGLIMDYCGTQGGALIENNVFYNNEGWCMVILNSDGATIRNNVCYHNGIRQDGSGEISTAGNYLKIHNNILVPRNGQLALNLRFARSGFVADTATIAENNNLLFVAAGATSVAWGGSAGTLSRYQSQNPRGWGNRSLIGNPTFVAESQFDFHLLSGSVAIDKGDSANAPLTDFDGNARPEGTAMDIGAFEFAASKAALLAPTNLRFISVEAD